MKKVIVFGILLGMMIGTLIAQQVADTIPIVHTTGESIMDFLKANAWNLALIVFLLVSEWLGSTGKVKEGSIYAWLINLIGKIIRSKTDLVKTKKAKFMTAEEMKFAKLAKTIVLIVLMSGIGLTASAQLTFKGFFKPVKQGEFYSHFKGISADKAGGEMLWLVRPAVNIGSMKYMKNSETKKVEVSNYVASGFGIGIQHYVDSDGTPFNNYGFNLLCLFNTLPLSDGTQNAGMSVAGTFGFMKVIDVGAGYDFDVKKAFVLTGIKYNF